MGIFELGQKNTKLRLENEGRDSNFMRNVALDTKMIRGTPVCVDLSRMGGGFHEEHGEERGEITRETLKNKSNHTSTRLTYT